jgi:lysophospholipid acyltransferase (LPLAT)-like uncharacterized protein
MHSVLMCTLKISTSGVQHAKPYFGKNPQSGALFVLWHDHTLLPLHVFRHQNIGVMMSTSRTGKIQAAFWRLYGWPTVWGSTKKREGVRALREVLHGLRDGQSFGFTPDGPKGPRHQAQPGVIYLASHAPAIVMPLGIAAENAWNLPTWDKYLIPKPFSKMHFHVGGPISIPSLLSREETLAWQERIAELIDEATREAERHLQRAKAEIPSQSQQHGSRLTS